MSKVTRHTDLTQSEGEPTSRAYADVPIEDLKIRVPPPRWPGAGTVIETHAAPRSPRGNAVAAVLLVLAGGLCVVLLHWIGVPWWAQLGGLFLPWALCLTLRPAWRSRAAPRRCR
jgi:membrane associated rhomboid family serine protease